MLFHSNGVSLTPKPLFSKPLSLPYTPCLQLQPLRKCWPQGIIPEHISDRIKNWSLNKIWKAIWGSLSASYSFYRWEDWGLEKWSDLPKFAQGSALWNAFPDDTACIQDCPNDLIPSLDNYFATWFSLHLFPLKPWYFVCWAHFSHFSGSAFLKEEDQGRPTARSRPWSADESHTALFLSGSPGAVRTGKGQGGRVTGKGEDWLGQVWRTS